MKPFVGQLKNEEGSVIVIAIFILLLVTMLGISATSTTNIELQIAGNDKIDKIAFYATEAAGHYVAGNPDLYGDDNSDGDGDVGITYPDKNSIVDNNDKAYENGGQYVLNAKQSFNGQVIYKGRSDPPKGSGNAAGTFYAHNYLITSTGYGASNATSRIEIGCYRIGLAPSP